MADIDVVKKSGSRAWIWILLVIAIALVLWFVMAGTGQQRTGGTIDHGGEPRAAAEPTAALEGLG